MAWLYNQAGYTYNDLRLTYDGFAVTPQPIPVVVIAPSSGGSGGGGGHGAKRKKRREKERKEREAKRIALAVAKAAVRQAELADAAEPTSDAAGRDRTRTQTIARLKRDLGEEDRQRKVRGRRRKEMAVRDQVIAQRRRHDEEELILLLANAW